MKATRNLALEAWMREHGYSANALAEAVNQAVDRLRGRPGSHDGASVRAWKSGRIRWPHTVTRLALEEVTGLPITDLGFVPRGRVAPAPAASEQEESDMKRRTLVGGIAAVAAAAAPGSSTRRIGMGDVHRLQHRFAEIIASDHRHGGQLGIEQKAAALADEALNLQNSGSASQRVRASLYASAAAFRSSAMWAAIDGGRYDIAKAHMREAQALAEMSGDQAIKFRIWSHTGTMYRHLGRPADALAANDVARSLHITRRDPLFACLGHARHAATLGLTGDDRGVKRLLGCARDSFESADPDVVRPVWMTPVRDGAELETLSLAAHLRLGNYPQAEAHAHRSLTLLAPQMLRDRAINTARLAQAQLGQGAPEAAVATATQITAAETCHARVSQTLRHFTTALRALAPDSTAVRSWHAHTATGPQRDAVDS
ncbi:XRE family transcriptional regulator [Streptomyces albidoflavus]|uniref:XRE family transcriptional regulator n=1 Tax=Streptomyces albidoflavus TaxID=1886 RepID=UPI00101E28C0|nr:XRE family transcriptional regulator [Streptomyces albidoflavus]RZD87035.1 Tat pathway signal sequence domain protein [Streptomyces albidoflavus]